MPCGWSRRFGGPCREYSDRYLDGESKETAEIRIPDAVGFLLLKTTVTSFRQKPKDPYDIYYYCRYSEDLQTIRHKLCASNQEQAVRETIERLRHMFADIDYQWVDMVLDHINVTGPEREREAQFVVRTIHNVVQDL